MELPPSASVISSDQKNLGDTTLSTEVDFAFWQSLRAARNAFVNLCGEKESRLFRWGQRFDRMSQAKVAFEDIVSKVATLRN